MSQAPLRCGIVRMIDLGRVTVALLALAAPLFLVASAGAAATARRTIASATLAAAPSTAAPAKVVPATATPSVSSTPATTAPTASSTRPEATTQPEVPVRDVQSGREMHRWKRYVRGFRREHNFAFSIGASSGTWRVKHLGTLDNQNFDNSGLYAKFQYSFHLPIYGGFGYLLGSSVGYHYETADRRQAFRPVSATQFPGILAGLVMNFTPVLRWSVAIDAYLERLDGLADRDGIGDDPTISITATTYDFGTFFDIFYNLNWGLRLEAHQRRLIYTHPHTHSGDQDFPVDASLKKDDQWMGLGLVYHLL